MRIRCFCLLLALASCAALAACGGSPTTLTGTWYGTYSVSGVANPSYVYMDLKETSDGHVTGSGTNCGLREQNSSFTITGTRSGSAVTLSLHSNLVPTAPVLDLNGSLSGDTITLSGTSTSISGGETHTETYTLKPGSQSDFVSACQNPA